MAQPISATAARSSETDLAVAQAAEARREKPAAETVETPTASTQAETTRPARETRPSLSAELRSMLLSQPTQGAEPSAGASSSTALIGRLLDALRKYEQS